MRGLAGVCAAAGLIVPVAAATPRTVTPPATKPRRLTPAGVAERSIQQKQPDSRRRRAVMCLLRALSIARMRFLVLGPSVASFLPAGQAPETGLSLRPEFP